MLVPGDVRCWVEAESFHISFVVYTSFSKFLFIFILYSSAWQPFLALWTEIYTWPVRTYVGFGKRAKIVCASAVIITMTKILHMKETISVYKTHFSFLQFDITTIQIRRDTTGEKYWDFCTLVCVTKTMPYIIRCFQEGRGSFIRHLYARLQRSPAHKFTRSDFYRWNYSSTFTPRHIVSRAEGCNFHFQPCKRLNIWRKCNNLHLVREYFLASNLNFSP